MKDLSQDMSGKICMITGANSGVGYESALALAKMGATVIMVCRSKSRGEAALQKIKELSNSNKVELFLADLADFKSIRTFVDKYLKKYDKLHVLMNNGGVMLLEEERTVTAYGYEGTFAINHLGPFLLTNLLLDTIKKSAPARIINVSALLYMFAKLDLNDVNLEKEKKYSGFRAYCNSKFAIILSTYFLAKKLKGTGVTVNTLHPGIFPSNIAVEDRDTKRVPNLFQRLFMISVEKGARTQIYLAVSPNVKDVTGKYFRKCKARRTTRKTYDESLQKALWELSEKMVAKD